MDELIGFGRVNDFSTFVLRASLAKRFGLFGEIPMWGGGSSSTGSILPSPRCWCSGSPCGGR